MKMVDKGYDITMSSDELEVIVKIFGMTSHSWREDVAGLDEEQQVLYLDIYKTIDDQIHICDD